MNTPKIRFKGFTDDWEQRKLGDVIEKLTGGASIAPDDYVDVGYRTIPKGAVNSSGVADMSGCKNVSQNFFKKNISSKTSSGELVTSLRDLVPTAPNMGRIVRICGETEDFLMPQGVYSIIVNEKISEDFLITYSNSPEYRKIIMAEKNGSTQVHIRNGEFLNIDIPLPSHEEQGKIGEYFKTLDHLITLHQRKCDETKQLKKFMLQKMFPKNGEKNPEIRFEGFTDDWEQRKVGEVTKELLDYDNFSSGLPLLTSSRSGLMYQSEYRGNATTENENTLFSVVPLNACTYRHMSDDSTFHLNINTLEKGLVSKEYPVFQENESNLKFIVQYINSSNSFTKFCTEQKKGGTRTRLYYKTLCEYKLMMPSIKEQNKTANFFDTLDHLITLHQRKCEKLKELKKFMLQNMFV